MNTTDKPIFMEWLIIATRDPQGRNVDQTCARKLTLPAKGSKVCSVTTNWQTAGTYTAFASWSPDGQAWNANYGKPVTFTITKASPPKPTFVRSAPYTLAGTHTVNGRQWKTSCEPYSATERCRTDIWASAVAKTASGYTIKPGWVFNNLTYLPSPRSLWASNPLGGYGKVGGSAAWTDKDGRQWRTECDTAVTGNGGCRAYIRTTVVAATPKTGGGYTYTAKSDWVFNNIVLFN